AHDKAQQAKADPGALAEAREALEKEYPGQVLSDADIANKAYELSYNSSMNQAGSSMGGDIRQAVDSVTSIITGILSGNITGGLAGASAPHLAEQLKGLADENPTAHKIAH